MNPQPSWEELAGYYSSVYSAYEPQHGAEGDDTQEIAKAKSSGKLRHIDLPAGKRVLDVGCGGGFFLRIARDLGASVQGVEPSIHGVAQARSRNIPVFHGTLDDYTRSGGANEFDIITANHVLEHVPEPVTTLSNMRSLLAPGGYLWIAVPNAECPLAKAIRAHWHSTDLPYHLMQFSPKSLAIAGARAGLRVISHETESLPRMVAATLRQWLRYRWLLPRRLTLAIRWIDQSWAPRIAATLDARLAGEAILMRFALA